MDYNFTLQGCVKWAKGLTAKYAKTHKGRNALEKECIKKGYVVARLSQIYKNVNERDKLGVFALTSETYREGGKLHRVSGFMRVR